MADRQVNGHIAYLMRLNLHADSNTVAGCVVGVGLKCISFVNVCHIVAILAALLSGHGGRHAMFARAVVLAVPLTTI